MLIEEASYNCSASTQLAVAAGEVYRHWGELAVRLEAQDKAFEEMQRKHQEELEAVKKSQQKKNEAWEKKQHDTDNLIGFLLRAQATQQESIFLSIDVSNLSRCYFDCHF
ncbi:hypothetical protein CFC21_091097 [Triticum aestivum]|uniref:Uncharacterized protein n=2 Tax=Triticum aestivum TaxID=4565 RepID=A0A3B6QC39_WHEAT|nr:hypothetical protein CFC21_091097 [Triticum aestivum]